MLKRLLCLILGHPPWRVVTETFFHPTSIDLSVGETKGPSSVVAALVTARNDMIRRAALGGKVITMVCDRCGSIKTVEHWG
jgi:hypothetical protein